MFDITSSSPWPGLKPDYQSINDLLLAQFRATDRVRIASFGQRITMSPEFTADRAVARRFLREALAPPEVERSGPSPIWDAVDAAITTLEPEQGRRVMPHRNALPSPMTTVALALRQAYKLSVATELAPNRSYSVKIRSGDGSHRVRTRAWVTGPTT